MSFSTIWLGKRFLRKINNSPIKEDPTLLREGRLQCFLRKLLKIGHQDRCVYDKIHLSGSQPAWIYSLPKMYKARDLNSISPFCPIVSSVGTYSYELAKYLCILLEPHILSEHCALDTFTFVCEINELPLFGKFMVCFDVESLFTKYPWRSVSTWWLTTAPRETLISC